jgi:protein-tyrosine phosphatase
MPTRVLMVCLGNICRSPLAEGILTSKLPKNKFNVDSAGTGHWHVGEQPDKRSIEIAKRHGIDITNQRAMLFKPSFFDLYDYIYVMDNSNYTDVIRQAPNEEAKQKVSLLLDIIFPNENVDVPDPYYNSTGFDQVYEMLDDACTLIAEKLINQHS